MNFARKLIAIISLFVIAFTTYAIHSVQPFRIKWLQPDHSAYKSTLGHSTWFFLHNLTLKFPQNPTPQQSQDLHQFFLLFSQLYPCEECSTHFQHLISKFPPQTNSSQEASSWLCSMHNLVNQRLDKPQFDCSKISLDQDCDCGIQPDPLMVED